MRDGDSLAHVFSGAGHDHPKVGLLVAGVGTSDV